MANNPMDYLRQLEQMGEQMRQMFGNQDFMKNMMPKMPDIMNQTQGTGNPSSSNFNWMKGQYPHVDLYETVRDLIAIVELPGLRSQNDVKVSIEAQRLHIQGFVHRHYDSVPGENMHLSERQHGTFEREVTLPIRILPNEVKARYHNGLLEIAMRKDQRNPGESMGHTVPVKF